MDSMGTSRRELLRAAAASALAMPFGVAWAQTVSEDAITPFTFRASDTALADLMRRLDQTRWPEQETGTAWEQGPPLTGLRNLVDYWRAGYDWRRCEAELARWPQFRTRLDGLNIHFIHVRSRHPGALIG